MPIRSLTAFHVSIRLKKPIRHASFVRSENQTLLVRCELTDGRVGWGEGLPRAYVTGESIDSCWRHLLATDFEVFRSVGTAEDVRKVWDKFQLGHASPDDGVSVRQCFGNSVRCAVELALLDATCRSAGISLSSLIGDCAAEHHLQQPRSVVEYSGAIMSSSTFGQIRSALKMKVFGFQQVKVKVGAKGISDVDCLRRVRTIVGQSIDLRLDANESWTPDSVVENMQPLVKYSVSCLEQPVAHCHVDQLAHVRSQLNVPIMLDESLCSLADADVAIHGQWCDAFNVRLSKCGGVFHSLALIAKAKAAGLFCQLGCLVGETGILSAAGRHFATQVGDLRYVEGSFDRFLVKDRLTKEDLTFRFRGKGPALSGPGLGITVDEKAVRQRSCREIHLLR